MRTPHLLLLLGLGLLLACTPTVTNSPWSAARVAEPRGAHIYAANCGMCHGSSADGAQAPALVGKDSLPAQRAEGPTFRSAQDVFEYVSTNMPLPSSKAGSLSSADYWSVVEFLVRARGVPIPPKGLSSNNAQSIRIH